MADVPLPAYEHRQKALVGIIVPIFKIGPILSDTLKSLFDQASDDIDLCFILVVDGCPYTTTTQEQLTDYLYGAPFPVEVCFKKNEGVSIARNYGLDRLLTCFPNVDYVLFFDADDLAPPTYVQKSISALRNDELKGGGTGWAYADQFQFGAASQWVRYPRFILNSRFTINNVSQPTSLVTRELIDAGVRFDENLKAGIEDWEFWFSAATAGFEGVYVPDTYIKYRRLAGSRSSVNRANDAYTKFYLRSKHAESYKSRSLLQKEQAGAPRYAFWSAQKDAFQLTTVFDNTPSRWVSIADMVGSLLARARYRDPDAYIDSPYFPDLVVVGYSGGKAGLGMLFNAERALVASEDAIAVLVMGVDKNTEQEMPNFVVLRISRLFRSLVSDASHLSTVACDESGTTKERLTDKPGGGVKVAKIFIVSWLRKCKALVKDLILKRGHAAALSEAADIMDDTPPLDEEQGSFPLALNDMGETIALRAPPDLLESGSHNLELEIETIISSMRDEIKLCGNPNNIAGYPKESVVATHRATHWNISSEALGIKHIFPWLPSTDYRSLLGVIGSSDAICVSENILSKVRLQCDHASLHWFVPQSHSGGGKFTGAHMFDAVTPLVDSCDDLIKKPGRFYNGVPLWERADNWNGLVANALSSCDNIVNIGCVEATLGISALRKTGLCNAYFYIPSFAEGHDSKTGLYYIAEHLVAHLGVYKTIIVEDACVVLQLRAFGLPKSKILLMADIEDDGFFLVAED